MGASSTEGEGLEGEVKAAKRLAEGDTDGSPGLLGAFIHHVAYRIRVAVELGRVREDRLHLGIDDERHVSDHVGLVRAAQE